jgi:hypothetical protein
VDNVPRLDVPTGWTCTVDQYHDEVCDCDCGIWDPSCDGVDDSRKKQVFVIRQTEEGREGTIELLDEDQAWEAMSSIEHGLDVNDNGVLDGMEVLHQSDLGVKSALHGVMAKIIAAQGESALLSPAVARDGSVRFGDLGQMSAVATESCNMLTSDPDATSSATYTPVCVKDGAFSPLAGEPVGRCALLPKLEPGSQCTVPGGELYDGQVCLEDEVCTASTENSWDYTCEKITIPGVNIG